VANSAGPVLRSVSPRESAEEGGDADDDEDVGQVESGPEAKIEEVRDMAEPDAVDEVRDAAAEHEAECDREHGMPGARAREEDEHPEDCEGRQRDHDRGGAREETERDPGVMDVVDRERAGDLDLFAER